MQKKLLNLFKWFILLFKCVKKEVQKIIVPEEKRYTRINTGSHIDFLKINT